jgi:transcriptional regulator with XRE-family HTH domain
MKSNQGLSHEEYVADRKARDPEFAAAYDEISFVMDVAVALTDLREARGMSQRDLAAASGIKQPMINRIERGSQVPKTTTLVKLLRALDGVLAIDGSGRVTVAQQGARDTEDDDSRPRVFALSSAGQ